MAPLLVWQKIAESASLIPGRRPGQFSTEVTNAKNDKTLDSHIRSAV